MNNAPKLSSLRNRMTLTVIVLLTLAIIVVSISLSTTAKNTLAGIVREQAMTTARELANRIATEISSYQRQLQTTLTLFDADNLTSKELESFLARNPQLAGVFLRLGDDEIHVGNPWPQLGSLSFDEIVSGVGNPVLDDKANWQIPIWQPVKDQDDNVTGLLGFMVYLDPFTSRLQTAGGQVTIINQDGEAVLSSELRAIMQGDTRKGVTHGAIGEAIRAALSGKTGVIPFALDGNNCLLAYAPVAETNWGLTHQIPYKEAAYAQKTGSSNLVITALVCLLVMGGVVYFYAGTLVNPITKLSAATSVLAKGQLDQQVEITSRDEIGVLAENFNAMVSSLRKLVGGMGRAASELLAASKTLAFTAKEAGFVTEQVSATIQEVASGAARLAEEARQGSDLVEEMAGSTERMLRQATETGVSSMQVKEMAKAALSIVDDQNRAAEQTVAAVDSAEATIRQLSSYSEEIGRIVEIIGGISGQTDLLALNAAVEAARAGEHGLGFAVVAEQVRVLAEQTDNSTKEITDLIKRVKLGTEKAVHEMNTSRKAAADTQVAVQQTTGAFQNIVVAIEQADKEVAGITAELEALRKHTDAVVQVIHAVSAVSEESAASAEEVTAASEEQTSQILQIGNAANDLSQLANQLQTAIDAFRMNS